MPWEKKYDADKVTEAAMRHFWAQGYKGSSVSDLVAATGINRASLYNGFGEKRGLFLQSLRRYDRRERAAFLDRLARDLPPRDAIAAAFAAAASGRDDAPAGCLLVNTALELAPHDPEMQALVNSAFDGVQSFFRDRIRAAQRDGTVPAGIDAQPAAQTLLGLFLGLRVLQRAGAPAVARDGLARQAMQMLE